MRFEQAVTFLSTEDLQATAAFYEEKLGLELALDQGTCRIYRVSADGYVGFCGREAGASPDGVIFTLVCEDVDGVYAELRARGVSFEDAPKYNPDYDIYHCFLRDPNGYLLEVQRFEDPRWPRGESG